MEQDTDYLAYRDSSDSKEHLTQVQRRSNSNKPRAQEVHSRMQSAQSEEHYLNGLNLNSSQLSTQISDEDVRFWEDAFSERKQLGVKFCVYVLTISLLLFGRFTVPDNEPPCVVDKVQDWLLNVNYFILHNTAWRNAMQIICSLFMDIVYLTTAGYWVLNSHTSRLILTLVVFYGVRMLIQKVWYSPFPAGFWWYDPGFPSLVVPYGRGSDFFFSGHMGFLVICICEWRKNKQFLISWIYVIGAVYTCFILLAYQVHYSIDIFTGVFFAHYVFMFFDNNKEKIDGAFVKLYLRVFVCFYKDNPNKKKKKVKSEF